MKRIAAFFDIDGTIYRDSLMLDHYRYLIKGNVIKDQDLINQSIKALNDWELRQKFYDDYLHVISDLYQKCIKGLDIQEVDKIASKVINSESSRVYKYTSSRIKWHLAQNHLVIFISGSPEFIVDKMANKYQASDFQASKYQSQDGVYTGVVDGMWMSRAKSVAIDNFVEKYHIDLDASFAYGDTAGDISMLEKCGNAIAINPSKEFYNYIISSALSTKTKVIIERKDIIIELKDKTYLIKE